jgi:hypothetical protein
MNAAETDGQYSDRHLGRMGPNSSRAKNLVPYLKYLARKGCADKHLALSSRQCLYLVFPPNTPFSRLSGHRLHPPSHCCRRNLRGEAAFGEDIVVGDAGDQHPSLSSAQASQMASMPPQKMRLADQFSLTSDAEITPVK